MDPARRHRGHDETPAGMSCKVGPSSSATGASRRSGNEKRCRRHRCDSEPYIYPGLINCTITRSTTCCRCGSSRQIGTLKRRRRGHV